MRRFVEVIGLSAVVLVLLSCGGEQTAAPDEPPADGAKQGDPEPVKPDPAPEPPAPTRTTLIGKGKVATDAGTPPAVQVELSYGDDKVVEGKLVIGETTREIGGFVDGDRLRCWLRGGADGGTVQRGMLTGDARKGGGFAGEFAISTDGGEQTLRGTWEASPE